MLAVSYANLERLDDAKVAIEQLLQILPSDSIKLIQRLIPETPPERREHLIEGLRKASLPED